MTKEEFKAFFESQCIPADLPFVESRQVAQNKGWKRI